MPYESDRLQSGLSWVLIPTTIYKAFLCAFVSLWL